MMQLSFVQHFENTCKNVIRAIEIDMLYLLCVAKLNCEKQAGAPSLVTFVDVCYLGKFHVESQCAVGTCEVTQSRAS